MSNNNNNGVQMTDQQKKARRAEIENQINQIWEDRLKHGDKTWESQKYCELLDEKCRIEKSLRRCKGLTNDEKQQLIAFIEYMADESPRYDLQGLMELYSISDWAHDIWDNRGFKFRGENLSKLADDINHYQRHGWTRKKQIRNRIVNNALRFLKKGGAM